MTFNAARRIARPGWRRERDNVLETHWPPHSHENGSPQRGQDTLSSLVDEAGRTHEIIRITKHGHVAAVLMSADDLESLHETLHLLSTPGAVDELRQADADAAAGETVTGEQLRRRYGPEPR